MFPASIEYPVNADISDRDLDQDRSGGSVVQAFDPCRASSINTAFSEIACRSRTTIMRNPFVPALQIGRS